MLIATRATHSSRSDVCSSFVLRVNGTKLGWSRGDTRRRASHKRRLRRWLTASAMANAVKQRVVDQCALVMWNHHFLKNGNIFFTRLHLYKNFYSLFLVNPSTWKIIWIITILQGIKIVASKNWNLVCWSDNFWLFLVDFLRRQSSYFSSSELLLVNVDYLDIGSLINVGVGHLHSNTCLSIGWCLGCS